MKKNTRLIALVFILSVSGLSCQDLGNIEINWLSKSLDTRKGVIQVPENHDNPDEKKINITYLILKAQNKDSKLFPIVMLTGGPGGNTLNQNLVNSLSQGLMIKNRDVILFDQRGIGYSSPLPNMSAAAFDILAKDLNETEELSLTKTMVNQYKEKCKEQNANPQYYNSFQNAKDVGLLFESLGYKKYNLMGTSYGTRLGRIVQEMYPEYVNSSVLDSPAPLGKDFLLSRLESYSLALERIFDYCENNPDCKNKYPDLRKDYYKAIHALEKKPLKVEMRDSLNVYVNAQDGIYLLRLLLYQGNSRELTPKLIEDYIKGNTELVRKILEFEYQMIDGLNLSMLLSVEKYESYNKANSARVIVDAYENYPLLPVKMGFFDAFYQAGMDWHLRNLPLEKRKFENSNIPTLLFVNQFDPVTTPESAHVFKEGLNNVKLLILNEGGHGSGNKECKEKVVISFLNNPNGKLDSSCLNLYSK